jgi:hypothetical protein
MTNYVQKFSSSDLNAPPVCGIAGSLLKVLDACLVDGYGYSGISITSITRSGTTATATCSTTDMLRFQTGSQITISGATGGDASLYNGTFAITVASSTTFTYTMTSTPSGSATGTLVASTFLPIVGITRVGNIALVNTSVANSTMGTGDYFTISGANQSDYNVTARVTVGLAWVALTTYVLGDLVTNDTGKLYVCRTAGTAASSGGPTGTSTSISDGSVVWDYVAATGNIAKYFTYTVANTPTTPATGTIVHAKAGLQWTRPFAAASNLGTYRSADVSSNQFYLQVCDDGVASGTGAGEAACYGAEVLTGNNTPNNGGGANSGRFPQTTQASLGVCNFKKSGSNDVTRRPWDIWGDDRTFYYSAAHGLTALSSQPGSRNFCGFGHFIPAKTNDGYNTFIAGYTNFGSSGVGLSANTTLSATNCWVPRSYTTLGGSLAVGAAVPILTPTFPNPPDTGLFVSPAFVSEPSTSIRGRFPGLYYPWISNITTMNDLDTFTNITNMSGVTLHCIWGSSQLWLIDRYGPWA